MSAEYSAEEVLQYIEQMGKVISPRGLTYLRAYAKRIEADERAVPVAWQQKRRPEDYPDEWRECSKETFDFVNQRKESPWIVRELFDNPPAQAAQVESSFDGCTESNCPRCLTHPDHRGDMQHAGIGSYPEPDRVTWKGFQIVEDRSVPDHMILVRDSHASAVITATHPHSPDAADSGRVSASELQQLEYDVGQGKYTAPWVFTRMKQYITAALAAQGQDWRIGMFDRWNEAAQEKGYAGICEAINSVPPASPAGVPDVVSIMTHLPDNRAATRCELFRALALVAAPSAPEGGEVGL